MKFIQLALLTCLISVPALADVQVGDWTRLEGRYSGGLHWGKATIEYKVLGITADGNQEVSNTVSTGHEGSGTQTTTVKFRSKAELEAHLASCEQDGNQLETLTVDGKQIPTCKEKKQNVNIWLGVVPLGIVRMKGNVGGTNFDVTMKESFGAEFTHAPGTQEPVLDLQRALPLE